MKIRYIKILSLFFLGSLITMLMGCDLRQQKGFDFKPDTPVLPNFKTQTAWDWIKTNPNQEFNYMIQAINVTGLQNLYSQVDSQRTYLLLKDLAFTNKNGVLQVITGSVSGSLANLDATKINRLKNLLLYHVVRKYVDQGPTELKVLFQDYLFHTMLPGDDGIMSISRDERFRMGFNYSSTLPSSKKTTKGMLHNYVLKNGVAHLSTTYLRATPF